MSSLGNRLFWLSQRIDFFKILKKYYKKGFMLLYLTALICFILGLWIPGIVVVVFLIIITHMLL